MARKKQKYYVVWEGHEPGIYTSWADCKLQIEGYPNAKYKSFLTKDEAEHAFAGTYEEVKGKKASSTISREDMLKHGVELNSLCVDAACAGNPGKMEYRGVYTKTGEQLFIKGPYLDGTNNVGEFLALVHGLALLKQKGSTMPIYSDSKIAISWIRQKTCKTKLAKTEMNQQLHQLIARAEHWLRSNQYTTEIRKWETKVWGEIPADFGRK
ncbi:ribonuclease HI [Lishizhenia tianjinensis]|uniref:Ribonuclease H n=1 Tax=Lishizhenia tianjinensis TaxID=477690 RepID=A0A1I6YIZ4_9FLAO|nr:ribonuclease H family protein [Lishizhenia tianjinensis]SFT50489.1 ribonuclease HI [Lishizhenia tianjinensis]